MPPKRVKRSTRKRKLTVAADEASDEDFLAPSRTWDYDLQAHLTNDAFSHPELIDVMEGKDMTAAWIRSRGGIRRPIFMATEAGLGMGVPPRDGSFTIDSIKRAVGPDRKFDIVEVSTQNSKQTTMKEFADYFKRAQTQKNPTLYNCLSLEFTETPLNKIVWQPQFVKEIDWVNSSWPEAYRRTFQVPVPATPSPKKRRSSKAEAPDTSLDAALAERLAAADEEEEDLTLDSEPPVVKYVTDVPYPKVQHYCLMSISECFTDFHLDFGGTSVWYHVNKGEKIFWLIPPTPHNFKIFGEWQMGEHNSFFADLVSECHRVTLKPGNTFIIPSGWIHAVYTPKTSLVFGGNFLHDFAIETQLAVFEIETRCKVYKKFRYPMWDEIHWYTAAKFVKQITGRNYEISDDEAFLDHSSGFVSAKTRSRLGLVFKEDDKSVEEAPKEEPKVEYAPPSISDYRPAAVAEMASCVSLTQGLKRLAEYLRKQAALQSGRKGIPVRIRNPEWLIDDLLAILHNVDITRIGTASSSSVPTPVAEVKPKIELPPPVPAVPSLRVPAFPQSQVWNPPAAVVPSFARLPVAAAAPRLGLPRARLPSPSAAHLAGVSWSQNPFRAHMSPLDVLLPPPTTGLSPVGHPAFRMSSQVFTPSFYAQASSTSFLRPSPPRPSQPSPSTSMYGRTAEERRVQQLLAGSLAARNARLPPAGPSRPAPADAHRPPLPSLSQPPPPPASSQPLRSLSSAMDELLGVFGASVAPLPTPPVTAPPGSPSEEEAPTRRHSGATPPPGRFFNDEQARHIDLMEELTRGIRSYKS